MTACCWRRLWRTLAALVPAVWLAACSSVSGPPTAMLDGQSPLGGLASVPVSNLQGAPVAELETPVDIWDRIRRGFSMPDLDGPLVREQEQWYLQRPDYLDRMTRRSRRYLFHIVEQLELRDMPTEIALLPYIESAFNPEALSSAKAAGLWQFIPSTGRHFALEQNALKDDRRNVLASTRAALDYLEELYGQFGDWQLALAAYNWGPGNVERALRRNDDAGRGTSYVDLDMPEETRQYIPKLQAVKNIVARPEQLGARLPDIGNHPFFDTVDITHDIDVATAARLAQVPLEEFRALNPAQQQPVIFAAGTPQILLPWDNATIFQRELKKQNPEKLASWRAWTPSENTSLAEAARMLGTNANQLRQDNHLGQRATVQGGHTLLVARRSPPAGQPQQASIESTLQKTQVQAAAGDTVASLAERYDLPARTVADWNQLQSGSKLESGREITIYLPREPASRQLAPTAPAAAPGGAKPSARRGKVRRAAATTATAAPAPAQTTRTAAPSARPAKRRP